MLHKAREGLARLFLGEDYDGVSNDGAFYYALLIGVMAQWLLDPESSPSEQDLAGALRRYGHGSGKPVRDA